MEECGEEEGDEPSGYEGDEDLDGEGEAAGGEDAAIEAEDGEFGKGDGEDVPELEDEEDLWLLSCMVYFFRWLYIP